ncbi:MAG: aconitase X catalytic domain-containing protein, partial [Alphaproteobacteria bacterium]|nr:aconitase X catalytic domain-containing protein [Alphaproteobacteria bacterium]
PITSAHIDGCVYFGEAGVLFAEKLRDLGGRVAVPSSLNVGALDIIRPELVRAGDHARKMSRRLMDAYVDLGCTQSWTCAPYQAGYRPKLGEQIAWAESNAIVFANSVLGARTNRYGDFFDICAALAGRAPYVGLHRDAERVAEILIDLSALSPALLDDDSFFPVLGAWLGRTVGSTVAAIKGLPDDVGEDRLKALGAAAASTGAVGLFHVIGVTPEARTEADAFAGEPPAWVITPTPADMRAARDKLSTTTLENIDCVALGSPHFSLDECRALAALAEGLTFKTPVYVCTRHAVLQILEANGLRQKLETAGVIFVIGTCVVVTPILKQASGVLMTNSGKFAHYSPSTVNHEVVYGSLADCVRSAVTGRVVRDERLWS